MKIHSAALVPPGTAGGKRAGFSLVEVALALAIISAGLVVLLGLFPAGLESSREAVDATISSLVLASVQERIKGAPLRVGDVEGSSPYFYDEHGAFVAQEAEDKVLLTRRYRVEVTIGQWKQKPADTSALAPLRIALFYPIEPRSGDKLGEGKPRLTVVTAAAPATGPSWQAIDPSFTPTIEN